MNAKEHYDHHLGNFYGWMIGDFREKQSEQQRFFEEHRISPRDTTIAVDLGCGHGLQAVSLALLGFKVEAVDFNSQLVDELRKRKEELTIEVHQQDLLKFLNDFEQTADVITCMGDTITHLPDHAAVNDLIKSSFDKLIPKGKLIISFRDLTREIVEEKRFLLVQSDNEKIHTCFLEYFPDYVKVYDILNTLENGRWKQTISWYPKIRIDEGDVRKILSRYSFDVIHSEVLNGMIYLIAQKK